LIENSSRFRNYKVTHGIIEFVEPDERGQINRLELDYNQSKLEANVKLINGVWSRIQALDFPDTRTYLPSLKGIHQFEQDISN
jgi:hypothetical protein